MQASESRSQLAGELRSSPPDDIEPSVCPRMDAAALAVLYRFWDGVHFPIIQTVSTKSRLSQGPGLMVKRDIFERLGGFSTEYFLYAEEEIFAAGFTVPVGRFVMSEAPRSCTLRSVNRAKAMEAPLRRGDARIRFQTAPEFPGWPYAVVSRSVTFERHDWLSVLAPLMVSTQLYDESRSSPESLPESVASPVGVSRWKGWTPQSARVFFSTLLPGRLQTDDATNPMSSQLSADLSVQPTSASAQALPSISWPTMSIERYAAFEQSLGAKKILRTGDICWIQIRPFFYRPLLPFKKYDAEQLKRRCWAIEECSNTLLSKANPYNSYLKSYCFRRRSQL